ncbi:MAG: UDP binding domain-containing protein, partial [Notoacmeibacter sp.]
VAKGMGLDRRIGRTFLHAGPGYGGSCFPKDTLALVKSAQDAGQNLSIVEAVIEANNTRKQQMAFKIKAACGGSVKNKKIAVLGLTFKPNTDDMRDAPSLEIIPDLLRNGALVQAYDPKGMEEAEGQLQGISFARDSYQCLENADALVIITEWDEFRALDLERVKALMSGNIVVDLRNIYNPAEMATFGFSYHSIGR